MAKQEIKCLSVNSASTVYHVCELAGILILLFHLFLINKKKSLTFLTELICIKLRGSLITKITVHKIKRPSTTT